MKERHLAIIRTEQQILEIRRAFQLQISKQLNLIRVSAPIFLPTDSGLNDDLNGVETPIVFDFKHLDRPSSILHSLAKWKRQTLREYEIQEGSGIYTDMNAIRKDEVPSPTHSFYVDQWDWEKRINPSDRTVDYLKQTVERVYEAIKAVQKEVHTLHSIEGELLPERITFVTSQQLEDEYPSLKPKEREDAICRKEKAVFVIGIGHKLKSGQPHDGRAPDYDDWDLNGDILVYHRPLDCALELSSMGIRVDAEQCRKQLELSNTTNRLSFPFHKALVAGELPSSIGGGIGQSRLCMFILGKQHIGEVQVSLWPEKTRRECAEKGSYLL